MVRKAIVLAAVAAALSAGCGDGGNGGATPTASPTDASESTGATGGSPPPTPAAGWTGSAGFDMSGGVTARADLTMVIDTVSLDPAELVVVWTDEAGGTFLAILWTGTRPPELGAPLEGFLVNITTPETREHGSYSDYAGGCTVTLDTFDEDGMSGSFACTDLELPDGQLPAVEASGGFSVSRTA